MGPCGRRHGGGQARCDGCITGSLFMLAPLNALRRVAAHRAQAANATGVPACITVAATTGVDGTRILDVERWLSTGAATPEPSASSTAVGAIVAGVVGGLGENICMNVLLCLLAPLDSANLLFPGAAGSPLQP